MLTEILSAIKETLLIIFIVLAILKVVEKPIPDIAEKMKKKQGKEQPLTDDQKMLSNLMNYDGTNNNQKDFE